MYTHKLPPQGMTCLMTYQSTQQWDSEPAEKHETGNMLTATQPLSTEAATVTDLAQVTLTAPAIYQPTIKHLSGGTQSRHPCAIKCPPRPV